MAAFKQFNTNQVVITPFNANKDFTFVGSEMTGSMPNQKIHLQTLISILEVNLQCLKLYLMVI